MLKRILWCFEPMYALKVKLSKSSLVGNGHPEKVIQLLARNLGCRIGGG